MHENLPKKFNRYITELDSMENKHSSINMKNNYARKVQKKLIL